MEDKKVHYNIMVGLSEVSLVKRRKNMLSRSRYTFLRKKINKTFQHMELKKHEPSQTPWSNHSTL